MIPDSNNPSSSTQSKAGKETVPQEKLAATEEQASALPESSGVKVSHRSADTVPPTTHLTAADETTPSREDMHKQLMAALKLYDEKKPGPGESNADFKQRHDRIKMYDSELILDALNESLLITLTKEKKIGSLPRAMICNLITTAVMAAIKLKNDERLADRLPFLLDAFSQQLPDLIEVLTLHYQYSFQPQLLEDEDRLHYFCELAARTQFMPATWLVTRLALKPNGPVSPGQVLDNLSALQATRRENVFVLTAFALQPDDLDITFSIERPDNGSEYHQALWLFSSLFSYPKKRFWPGGEQGFSPELQRSLMACLRQTLEIMTGNSVLLQMSSSEKAGAESSKRLNTRQRQCLDVFGINDAAKAEKNKKLSNYQRDIAGLTLAWHFRQKYISRDADPLQCGQLFRQIAERSNFELLFIDAARVFASFGRYRDAIDCLEQFRKCSVSPRHKSVAQHLCESYLLAYEACPQKTDENERPVETHAKTDENEWLAGTHAAVENKSHKKGQKAGKKKSKKVSATRKGKAKSKHQEEARPPSPEVRGTDSQPLKTERVDMVHPEGEWLPDGHPAISEFYSDLNAARNNFDLALEAKHISQWLQKGRGRPMYGRVCEEAAWFYIRQMESPFPGHYSLDGEDASHHTGQAKLAGQWLSRAEACYFQVPRGIGNDPDELREIINTTYEQHPQWHDDPEYRKRIRGICSSRGHLYSNLSAYAPTGKYSWNYHQKLTRRYMAFYELKHLADPSYRPVLPTNYSPSIP